MEIGYMRLVSRKTEMEQAEALVNVNCTDIRKDDFSSEGSRPELQRLVTEMEMGDCLVIYNLQTIADSLMQLIDILREIDKRKIRLISLSEGLDTSVKQASSFFSAAEILADFQSSTISLNTKAGLLKAQEKGVKVGRPPISSQKLTQALDMYRSKQFTFNEIRKQTDIGKTTIYRHLQNDRH